MTKTAKANCIYQGSEVSDEAVVETLAYGDAIMAGIERVCEARTKAGLGLNMRSVAGALVSVLAHYLAGIEDEDTRQQAYAMAGHELADMIVTNIELGTHVHAVSKKDFVQ